MAPDKLGNIAVRISYDEMEGFLSLPEPDFGEEYNLDEVLKTLEVKGLRFGVDQGTVKEMIEKGQFNRERMVATGIPVQNGADGYFQLNFNVDFNNRPTVRPDGSVDYWSVHVVEIVEEGQVIAIYHEPIAGENGMTVTGKPQLAKRGRPQPPLTGKGFERSDDGKIYTASYTGKIEKNGNRIQISPVYEVFGNVDLKTGNIDFRGDVIIHGNVNTGAEIKATGTVTIDGIVEAATIEAGKDIALRGGVLGKGVAKITSKGNISAKFLEYANVECEGFLEASSALDCVINVHDRLLMNDSKSTIVGGKVYAARGIELCNCGNESEIKTELQVGMDKVMAARVIALQGELSNKTSMLDKVNSGLAMVEDIAKNTGVDMSKDERRLGLLRARISTQADISKINEEMSYLNSIIQGARGANVKITNTVHAGVQVTIDNITAVVKDTQHSVQFIIREGNCIMVPVSY